MKFLKKKHEAPQFEVIVNKESNKKFFVASESIDPDNARNASVHVQSWDVVW